MPPVGDTLIKLLNEVFKLTLVFDKTAYLVRAALHGLLQLNVLLEYDLLALLTLNDFLPGVLQLEHARVDRLCGNRVLGWTYKFEGQLLDLMRLLLHSLIE